MGKKPSDIDDPLGLFKSNGTAVSVPAQEPEPTNDDPLGLFVKKKEDTVDGPESANGTDPLGLFGSEKPVEQPTEPGVKPTEEVDGFRSALYAQPQSGFLVGGLYDLGKKFISVLSDDYPAASATLKGIASNINYEDFLASTANPNKKEYESFTAFRDKLGRKPTREEVKTWIAGQEQKRVGVDEFQNQKSTFETNATKKALEYQAEAQIQQQESQKFLSDIPKTWKDAKGVDGVASYIGSAMGNAIAQMPLALVTKGASSFFLEKSDAYNEATQAIAQELGITPEDVVDKKLDEPAKEVAQTVGAINAALDSFSAGQALKPFQQAFKAKMKKEIQQEVLKRGLWQKVKQNKGVEVAKNAITEYATERAQGTNTQIGAQLAAGKDFESAWQSVDQEQAHEEGLQGLFGAGGISLASIVTTKQKPPKQVIAEQKAKVTTNNVQSAEAAAEVIQQAVDEDSAVGGIEDKFKDLSGAITEDTTQKTKVFVYGTLMNPETRKQALGEDAEATPHTIEGMNRESGEYSSITPGEGKVEGMMMDVTPEQLDKLDKYESNYDRKEVQPGVFAYVRKPSVNEKGQPVQQAAQPEQQKSPEEIEPERTVGKYTKRGGKWYLTNRDGALVPVLDLDKQLSTGDSNVNTELEDLRKIEQDIKSDLNREKPMSNYEKGQVMAHEPVSIKSSVLRYFLGGGKLRFSPLIDSVGRVKSRGAKEELGYSKKERSGSSHLFNENTGISVEALAERLALAANDVENDWQYRNTILDLVGGELANFSRDELYRMLQEEVDPDYGIANSQKIAELDQISDRINELESQDQAFEEKIKQDINDERRVYPEKEGDGNQVSGAPGQEVSSEQATFSNAGESIQQAGDKAKSEQALKDLQSLNLSHVKGLGMGQNQAKGTYLSTEAENRYATEDKPAQPAKANITNPFVSDNGQFYNIQRQLIQQRFNKNSVDDLNEAEADLLSEMISAEFREAGYDSIYLPQSETQEGELIVFDPKNVEIDGKQISPADSNSARPSIQENNGGLTASNVAGPPAEPPTTQQGTEDLAPKQGERQTIVKLQEESNLVEPLKEGIEDFKNYEIHKQKKTQAAARKTIESMGEDEALRYATSFKIGRTQEEKIALLSELAESYGKQFRAALHKGDTKASEAAYSKYMTAMDHLSSYITDTAQALSYMGLVGQIFETKTGATRFAKQQIEESREGALKNYEEVVNNAKSILDEINKMDKAELLKLPKIQELINEAKAKSPRSIKSRTAAKNLRNSADELKKAWANLSTLGATFDPKQEAQRQINFDKALAKYIRDLIKSILIETGEKIGAIRDETIKRFKDFAAENKLTVSDSKINSIVDEQITDSQVKDYSKKYKKDLRQTVADYVATKNPSFEKLVSDIAEAEEMTPEQAKAFATKFKSLFDEAVQKKKEQIINKYLPKDKPKVTKPRKEFYEKVVELNNAGAVSDQQMEDMVAQVFNLPQMTPEIAEKIGQLVDDINKAPDGRFKNIAITKLTDYIAQQQKFNPTNYFLASYKAGIFSGLDTQAMNLLGNFSNVIELGFMMGITNPKKAARFYRAITNPRNLSRSGAEALTTLKTGFDPRVLGDQRRALEQHPRSFYGLGKPLKGWRQLFDPSWEQQKKYVFRALSAGDLLFSTPINDALQENLFYQQAAKKGLKGKEATKYVKENMGYNYENILKAGMQATQEAKSGAIPNDKNSRVLRTYEIIEQQRDPEVVARARQYASEQIMTNTPKGFIGLLAHNINNTVRQIPILSTFIPVVNFAANAMSRAVQYMPHTALAREVAHDISKMSKGQNLKSIYQEKLKALKDGDIETEMRLRRAFVGVATMATLIALTSEDDEGENLISQLTGKPIRIHGFGPGTQFNRQKNYQLEESGWKPYSIQVGDTYIPYKNYPGINVLLATMGEWNDAKRYGKLTNKDADERFLFALQNSFKVISEQGFFTSLNTLLSAILEGEVKSGVDVVSKTAQGELFPKFQRNIANLFDNKIYSRNNVRELITRSIPVINTYANEPLVNALGEPIEKNWTDRIQLWNQDSYSKHEPIWEANGDKQYTFPVPTKMNLEEKFERKMTSEEYNEYFERRGKHIVQDWSKDMSKLSKEDYAKEMEKIVRHASYRAMVEMGVMKSDIMEEINYQLRDLDKIGESMREMKKDLKE